MIGNAGDNPVRRKQTEASWLMLMPAGLLLGVVFVQLCDALMLHAPSTGLDSAPARSASPDAGLQGPRHLDGPPADVVQLRIWTPSGDLGALRVRLRPDLSASSADFVREAASMRCAGSIDRADRAAVHARFACAAAGALPQTAVSRGPCPPGVPPDPARKCPSGEPQCGCHGPLLSRGMVAWADGGTGPDFFVAAREEDDTPTKMGHGHTVFGEVEGDDSWAALERLRALPATQTDEGWLRPSSAAFRVATAA